MLKVEQLRFWYEHSEPPIVYDCNLTVADGQFVAIVGESGGGKTTLLRLAAGLLQAYMSDNPEVGFEQEGTVQFNGTLIERPSESFAYVPQRFTETLFPMLTAEKNVRLSLWGDPERKALESNVRELMGLAGIMDVANYPISKLSGGQQQRVCICRALAGRATVLFMDEPFANLDFVLKSEIAELLKAIRQKRKEVSLLFVTHDIEGATLLADKIVGVKTQYGMPRYESWSLTGKDKRAVREQIRAWIS